jgi:peptidoglycan/xylan/chitin deacetylase (PgdA/CDA1 family)
MPRIDPKYPDLPAGKWYDYGYKEGLPRLLDVFDRRKVKVTSHMVGAAVDLHPQLAKEIVERGHEAAGHGQTWTAQYSMTPEEERASYRESIESIRRATGTRPVGFNAFWLRGTSHTLGILQSLGFIYYIDDVSRDEPFLINGLLSRSCGQILVQGVVLACDTWPFPWLCRYGSHTIVLLLLVSYC